MELSTCDYIQLDKLAYVLSLQFQMIEGRGS